ncbi:MAG: hypothetical protein E6G27_05490 [Actinobacteria bacterium]|nr:MAG: hypothetical protein E6G27_05490 [Actinomycetota bacterium]
MRLRPPAVLALLVALLAALAVPARATFPFPPGPGSDPYDYTRLHVNNGACTPLAPGQSRPPGSDLPSNFDCRNDWKLTDYAAQPGDPDYDPAVANNPQELHGVKGAGVNRAWEVTTGRPDTVIAVLDSGIEWNTPELVNKIWLNWRELPLPCAGATAASCPRTYGSDWKQYDANHDGVFNIQDYAGDPRLHPANGTYLTPEDLIRTFSDGIDHSADGYVNDMAGWDFYQRDNNPADDVTYGHGTGEAKDSSGELEKALGVCGNCMFMPLRVGDSFVANINDFASAVVYAADHGASVVQEALGTINHTAFGQAAVDYAYRHGVLVVASEADEEAGHHNYPAALNHTMVVNSTTHFVDVAPYNESPKSYLELNGCTNFGGYTWVTVESSSCSSEATGLSSGMAGLVYSAARNAIAQGRLRPDASGMPLAAEEVKQLFRAAADDIDFSTPNPPGPANNFATTLPGSQRFVTTPGWDQITGWGRANARNLLDMVNRGQIPPQADITSPRWWQPLGTAGRIDVTGTVAAPRSGSYTYEVQFAPGVQPPKWPAAESWTTVATGGGTQPTSGRLATLDLAAVRAAISAAPPPYSPADDPTSRELPEKDAFRVRVVVRASGAPDAVGQRQFFSVTDPTLAAGFPKYLDADGASSPAFADIDGDGVNELIVADGNGFVHAFKANGTEAPGWPTHTDPIPLPTTGANAFTTGQVPATVYAPVLLGSPAVADLFGTGWLDVAVADSEGSLHVWDHSGHPLPGFPVHTNPQWSTDPPCQTSAPACDSFGPHPVRDHVNTVDHSFSANPSVGRLDPGHPGLDLVAGADDGHVYAFHADGTPVPGWPVLLRDPAKVASVDPVSHRISFVPGANARYGRQVITTPSIGHAVPPGGTAPVPVVGVNVDEEYAEAPNWSQRDPALDALAAVSTPGNTRTYLLWPDGTNHPADPARPVVTNLGNNAYMPGWPVKIAMVTTELLPNVGSGSNGPPVFADVNGDGRAEIATASIAGPPYLLRSDGTSYYGSDPSGKYLTMGTGGAEFKSNATDAPSVASLGGGVFGRLGGRGSPLSWAMGGTGLRRLLDVVLPQQQLGAEDHIDAWDAGTGTFQPGFPAQMNDLMFFNTPAVADVNGSGQASVIQGSAVYDLRAYGLGGTIASGWPKFTGGWSVTTPAVGDFFGDGGLELTMPTREGNLFVWRTQGKACGDLEWPKYQHDLHNSGDYGTDASPPGLVRNLRLQRSGGHRVLSLVAPGDDGYCGTADRYVITVDGAPWPGTPPGPGAAGTAQSVDLGNLGPGSHTVTIQAADRAGNLSPPATTRG